MLNDAYLQWAQWVESLCGVYIGPEKSYLFATRLKALMREHGCQDLSEFFELAHTGEDPALISGIIDALTTHETCFFRDPKLFDLLRRKVQKEYQPEFRQGTRSSLHIWSAACSFGQEPYSTAMILKECLGDLSKLDIRIHATDISQPAIERARVGRYGVHEVDHIRNPLLKKYMQPHDGAWQVRQDILAMVQFEAANIFHAVNQYRNLDLIFCRNVLIYFVPEKRLQLLDAMSRSLKPGGLLLLGSSESMHPDCRNFKVYKEEGICTYQLRDSRDRSDLLSSSASRLESLLKRKGYEKTKVV